MILQPTVERPGLRTAVALAAALLVLASHGALAAGTPRSADGPLDLNRATSEQLQGLPGVGEVRARAIVARRSEQPFRTVDELVEVKGIGPSLLERLRPHVRVGTPRSAAKR